MRWIPFTGDGANQRCADFAALFAARAGHLRNWLMGAAGGDGESQTGTEFSALKYTLRALALSGFAEEEGVQNLRVMCHDGGSAVCTMIPDNSLNMVQLFFPDPHKARHNKLSYRAAAR